MAAVLHQLHGRNWIGMTSVYAGVCVCVLVRVFVRMYV